MLNPSIARLGDVAVIETEGRPDDPVVAVHFFVPDPESEATAVWFSFSESRAIGLLDMLLRALREFGLVLTKLDCFEPSESNKQGPEIDVTMCAARVFWASRVKGCGANDGFEGVRLWLETGAGLERKEYRIVLELERAMELAITLAEIASGDPGWDCIISELGLSKEEEEVI